jgi:hypothetical protein
MRVLKKEWPRRDVRPEIPRGPAKEVSSLTQTVYRTGERERMVRILKEAEQRYRCELLDADERELLWHRVVTLKKKLAASA